MAKKNITIDDLAAMVKRGFDETASKQDLKLLRNELKKDIKSLGAKVDSIDLRLKSVEQLLLRQHSAHLMSLESRVKRLEQLYAIKFQ